MRKRSAVVVLLLVVALASSCATIKPWGQRSPQEKALSFYQIYNKQFDATMALANKPGLTDQEKSVVRAKKAMLTEVRPLISAYDGYITEGKNPSDVLETKILDLLDKLAQ